MTPKAVLWDLDGTIADSAALHFQAWQSIMDRHQIEYSYQLFIDAFGRNNVEILAEHFGDDDSATIERVSLEKEAAFRALIRPGALQLLPGVQGWLAYFRRQGIVQVVGSSGPMANIAAIVRALDIGDYFLALVTGTHLPRGKPDPAIFLRCAAVTGADPDTCLVIEDSIHGIEAAQRAGMYCIAVGALASSDLLRTFLAADTKARCVALPSLAFADDPNLLLSQL